MFKISKCETRKKEGVYVSFNERERERSFHRLMNFKSHFETFVNLSNNLNNSIHQLPKPLALSSSFPPLVGFFSETRERLEVFEKFAILNFFPIDVVLPSTHARVSCCITEKRTFDEFIFKYSQLAEQIIHLENVLENL